MSATRLRSAEGLVLAVGLQNTSATICDVDDPEAQLEKTNSSPEAIRRRLLETRKQRRNRVVELESIRYDPPDSEQEYQAKRNYLHREIDFLDEEVRGLEEDLGRSEVRLAVERAQKSESLGIIVRHAFLLIASCSLVGLAYLFRESALASIPLTGLVALL